MQGSSYYTITREDVGKSELPIFGGNRQISVAGFKILPRDIGKRVFLDWATNMLTVESDAARAAREKG